jgi:anti-sigma regulatory factor (Ser/Thr protein kinase)
MPSDATKAMWRNFVPPVRFSWHTIGLVPGLSISHRHCAGDALSRALAPALEAVAAFGSTEGLDGSTLQRLAIVTEEIVVNLIEHASHEHDISFRLGFSGDEDGVFVCLEDDSTAFDPSSVTLAELPNPIRGGGVGLSLVRAWSEIVCYESHDGWNRLTLHLRPRATPVG